MNRQSYKGFSIVKRSSRSSRTSAQKSGYRIFGEGVSFAFSTLTEAKAFIDTKVGA